jgi:ubiquinone/menaquinone biosynthesis C-methylase UbiE
MKEWKKLDEGFTSLSDQYDEIYYTKGILKKIMEKRRTEILGEIDPRPGEDILEIGPGSGAYTLPILEKGAHITAIDVSEGMINVCKKKVEEKGFNAQFYHGNILNIPVKDGTMDKAMAIGVMTHLPEKPMVKDAVNEMLRTVKKGGNIWFDVPRYHSLKILFTKLYLKVRPLSAESRTLENHLFTKKEVEALVHPHSICFIRKTGYSIYYLVKVAKD